MTIPSGLCLLFQLVPLVPAYLLPLLSGTLPLSVLVRTLVKQLGIDFHEELHCVVNHSVYSPINSQLGNIHSSSQLLTYSNGPLSFRREGQT